jgi:hypothetical protein
MEGDAEQEVSGTGTLRWACSEACLNKCSENLLYFQRPPDFTTAAGRQCIQKAREILVPHLGDTTWSDQDEFGYTQYLELDRANLLRDLNKQEDDQKGARLQK